MPPPTTSRRVAWSLALVIGVPSIVQGTGEKPPLDASEVERLKQLLRTGSSTPAITGDPGQPPAQATTEPPRDAAAPRLLSGAEGRAFLSGVATLPELAEAAPDLRTSDIVFHIAVRQDGQLAASRAWNLKALGHHQYWCLVALQPGLATITVRDRAWAYDHGGPDRAPYLLFYHAPPGEAATLLLISSDELQLPAWENPPGWLPALPDPVQTKAP